MQQKRCNQVQQNDSRDAKGHKHGPQDGGAEGRELQGLQCQTSAWMSNNAGRLAGAHEVYNGLQGYQDASPLLERERKLCPTSPTEPIGTGGGRIDRRRGPRITQGPRIDQPLGRSEDRSAPRPIQNAEGAAQPAPRPIQRQGAAGVSQGPNHGWGPLGTEKQGCSKGPFLMYYQGNFFVSI